MASTMRAFERELKIATAGLDEKTVNMMLAQTAREALHGAIQAGEASNEYQRFVNGREGASEDEVKAPGPILYVFSYQSEVATFAVKWAQENSPVRSGRYRKSWFVLVNGRKTVDPSKIQEGVPFIVTNDQPYARKIHVGHMKMKVPPGIVERLRQAIRQRFGNTVTAEVKFITLAGGYRLKRGTGKKGSRGGDQMTYPAVVVTPL